jgi:hypothetical protein
VEQSLSNNSTQSESEADANNSKKAWSFLLILVPMEKGGLFAGEVTVLRLDVWDEGERGDSFLTAYLES